MVPGREADACPIAILSQGSAFGVILAVPALNWSDRQLQLALRLRRARRRRPDVGGGVADPRARKARWCRTAATAAGGTAHSLFPAADLADLCRLLSPPTFGAYWALSLGLTWFTPFIVNGLGFSQQQAGFISILPWVFGATIVMLTGWISQVMLARGFTDAAARAACSARCR